MAGGTTEIIILGVKERIMAEKESLEVGFLQEDPHANSSMRLMCFISLFAAIGFGTITILGKATDGSTGLFMTMGFLLGAFAPKALQKVMEDNLPKK